MIAMALLTEGLLPLVLGWVRHAREVATIRTEIGRYIMATGRLPTADLIIQPQIERAIARIARRAQRHALLRYALWRLGFYAGRRWRDPDVRVVLGCTALLLMWWRS